MKNRNRSQFPLSLALVLLVPLGCAGGAPCSDLFEGSPLDPSYSPEENAWPQTTGADPGTSSDGSTGDPGSTGDTGSASSETESTGEGESTGGDDLDGVLRFGMLDDGAFDRITVEDVAAINAIGAGDFTFEAWFKAHDSDQPLHPTIFSNRMPAPGGGVIPTSGFTFMFSTWHGTVRYPAVQLGSLNYLSEDPPNLLDDQWHLFSATRDGGELAYYADGVRFAVFELTEEESIASEHALWIGHDDVYSLATHFNGSLAEVRIWGVARSEEQIQATMQSRLMGDELGLVSAWSLDEGRGQNVMSVTGIGHGILGSTPDEDANDPQWDPRGERPF